MVLILSAKSSSIRYEHVGIYSVLLYLHFLGGEKEEKIKTKIDKDLLLRSKDTVSILSRSISATLADYKRLCEFFP